MFRARAPQAPTSRKGRGLKTFVDLTVTVIVSSIESFRLTGIDESIVVVTIPLVRCVTIAILVYIE